MEMKKGIAILLALSLLASLLPGLALATGGGGAFTDSVEIVDINPDGDNEVGDVVIIEEDTAVPLASAPPQQQSGPDMTLTLLVCVFAMLAVGGFILGRRLEEQ